MSAPSERQEESRTALNEALAQLSRRGERVRFGYARGLLAAHAGKVTRPAAGPRSGGVLSDDKWIPRPCVWRISSVAAPVVSCPSKRDEHPNIS